MADLNVIIEKLNSMLEDAWGVEANPQPAVVMQPGEDTVKPAKQTEFDVELTGFGPSKKIKVIQAVRGILGTPLRDTKELVEKAPVNLKESVSQTDADEIKRLVEDAGGQVVIK